MGIKKMFQKKEPTEEEIRSNLVNLGISTKTTTAGGRQEKFGAFRSYAQERSNNRQGLAPVNPYANVGQTAPGSNPYANGANGNASDVNSNPYGNGTSNGNGNGNGNAYGKSQSSNPYGSATNGGQQYLGANGQSQSSPYGSSTSRSSAASQRDPYAQRTARPSRHSTTGARDTESIDLNDVSSVMIEKRKPVRSQLRHDDATLDLNEDFDDMNLNDEGDLDIPQEEQVNSEDEEVESIKQDIRFVKQESVASTRNTLRMAQEADASATNTMGMLGAQSERLYNAEQNILLSETQTSIAEQKVGELRRLNRSIFVPAYGNPFNKKLRLRQQEENIKNAKAQEKYMRESNRQQMYASEQRLKLGITNNATNSEVHQKYAGEKHLDAAKRYQFENDSEDDDMEKEIAGNLDQIGLYAKKLSASAKTMGQEVDSQNERLRKIEEDADRLDINVHMNSTRLSNIR